MLAIVFKQKNYSTAVRMKLFIYRYNREINVIRILDTYINMHNQYFNCTLLYWTSDINSSQPTTSCWEVKKK
jgi:hypothetical protein